MPREGRLTVSFAEAQLFNGDVVGQHDHFLVRFILITSCDCGCGCGDCSMSEHTIDV